MFELKLCSKQIGEVTKIFSFFRLRVLFTLNLFIWDNNVININGIDNRANSLLKMIVYFRCLFIITDVLLFYKLRKELSYSFQYQIIWLFYLINHIQSSGLSVCLSDYIWWIVYFASLDVRIRFILQNLKSFQSLQSNEINICINSLEISPDTIQCGENGIQFWFLYKALKNYIVFLIHTLVKKS